MKIEELKPLEKNPFKSKGDRQIELIANSIKSFQKMMEIRKIVIDENNEILGGNKRFFALKTLGYTDIPDKWIEKRTDLTEEEKKEFIVKDNAHWGSEWDFDLLKEWNIDLQDCGVEINFVDTKIPEFYNKNITGEDIDKKDRELSNKFKESNELNTTDVICPKCFYEFKINGN